MWRQPGLVVKESINGRHQRFEDGWQLWLISHVRHPLAMKLTSLAFIHHPGSDLGGKTHVAFSIHTNSRLKYVHEWLIGDSEFMFCIISWSIQQIICTDRTRVAPIDLRKKTRNLLWYCYDCITLPNKPCLRNRILCLRWKLALKTFELHDGNETLVATHHVAVSQGPFKDVMMTVWHIAWTNLQSMVSRDL